MFGFPGVSDNKEFACSAGDLGSIPGLGRSPGEGNGNPLQYSYLKNPLDRGAWQATVHGFTMSRTPLSNKMHPHIDSVQSLSCVWLFATLWTTVLSITNSQSLLKLKSIESVMPSNHLMLCNPLLLPSSIVHSIRVFSNESVLLIRWPKYWSFSFSISSSKEYSGLISFRMDWLDLAVQRTLKSLLQHHSSKASILHCSAFFILQLSHSYMTTGQTIALTRWTFVSKVMCLHFSMLSRLVKTFLPRSKRLLISWLQSPSAVILEPHKIKSDTVSTVQKIYEKVDQYY